MDTVTISVKDRGVKEAVELAMSVYNSSGRQSVAKAVTSWADAERRRRKSKGKAGKVLSQIEICDPLLAKLNNWVGFVEFADDDIEVLEFLRMVLESVEGPGLFTLKDTEVSTLA